MGESRHIHRREVIKWSIPLAVGLPLGASLFSCNDKKEADKKTAKNKSSKKTKPKPNTTEVLYFNPKTKVLHYPGLSEKEKLDTGGLEEVKIGDWERMLDSGEARFEKEHSGLAFEKLALRHFQNNPSAESVEKSMAITARTFSKEYVAQNRFNWREYELLLQWLSLNAVMGDKWNYFSNAVSNASIETLRRIPKRMEWAKSKDLFEKRVAYINERKTDYMARLKSRLI